MNNHINQMQQEYVRQLRERTLQELMMVADSDASMLHAAGYKTKEEALVKIVARMRKEEHKILGD